MAASTATDCAGVMPQVTTGVMSSALMRTTSSYLRPGIALDAVPVRERAIPRGALGRVLAALQIVVRGLVGIHVPAARAALDAHVTDGHALVHGEAVEHVARVFVGEAHAAVHAQLLDDVEDDVLGVHAGPQLPVHFDAPDLQLFHGQGLRGQHVADLRGADAEGQGAERAVGGGVRIAAADGHARLGEAALGANDVDHAVLVGVPARRSGCRSPARSSPDFAASLPPWRPGTGAAWCASGTM
jgi:hypothetical protein